MESPNNFALTELMLSELINGSFPLATEIFAYSELLFVINPEGLLKMGVFFTSIKNHNGPNDKSSNLDREGVYRVWLPSSPPTYKKLFGERPKRPPKGGICETNFGIDLGYDVLHTIMPHPVYAWGNGLAINNPTEENWIELKWLFDEAYYMCLDKYDKKVSKL